MKENYVRKAQVLRCIDGDTIEVMVALGFTDYTKKSCRIYGVNTPETRGPERKAGLMVKAVVNKLIPPGSKIVTRSRRQLEGKERAKGKFIDRYVGDIQFESSVGPANLAHFLLDNGLAKPYDGKEAIPRFNDQELEEVARRCRFIWDSL